MQAPPRPSSTLRRRLPAMLASLLLSAAAQALPPDTIGYKGYLTDPDGLAIVYDTPDIQVELYNSESGGTPLFSETHAAVEVIDGRFDLLLGSVGAGWSAIDFGQPLWLALTLGGETLDPRIPFSAVPYARATLQIGAVQSGKWCVGDGVKIQCDQDAPVGTTGPQGPAGPTGLQGPAGTSAWVDGVGVTTTGGAAVIEGNATLGDGAEDSVVVNGALKIASGTPGAGKVLTSDAVGNAIWGSSSSAGWGLAGNGGTSAGTNFIGTTDNQALELKANGLRALRIEPPVDANAAPGLIGGHPGNSVTPGVRAATIAGGGDDRFSANYNSVTDDFGTISGGAHNQAGNGNADLEDSPLTTVAGGANNTASAIFATVSGGYDNTASGDGATVVGGVSNIASGTYASVLGGLFNTASGSQAVVLNGQQNSAAGDFSLAAGWKAKIQSGHSGAFLFSDQTNALFNSQAANEFAVRATGGVRFVRGVDVAGNPSQTVTIPAAQGVVVVTTDGSEQDPQVGSLTAAKWCASNAGGTAIDCTLEAPAGGDITDVNAGAGLTVSAGSAAGPSVTLAVDTGVVQARVAGACATGSSIRVIAADGSVTCEADDGVVTESDPKVGAVTSAKWCVGDGSAVQCSQAAPVTVESDPQVGAVTSAKWCIGDGSAVQCNQSAPLTVEGDPQVGTLVAGKWCSSDGAQVNCASDLPLNWGLSGNSGTTGGTHFIGTTDNQPLEFRVNNLSALRIKPPSFSNLAPNLIGGYSGNNVTAGVDGATIAGGGAGPNESNRVTDDFGTVGGGTQNVAGDSNELTNAAYATVSGGTLNEARGLYSSVVGGWGNRARGWGATAAGGAANDAAGDLSFVAGWGGRVGADHGGAFLYADAIGFNFDSVAANEFAVRATGGVRLRTSGDLSTGCDLAAGSGTWSCTSDRHAKENFAPVDGREVLEKVAALPIESWNFKTQNRSVRHIGPMAQDFHAAFGFGETDTSISTVDADGVALAAIQGMYRLVREQQAMIETLRGDLQQTTERLRRLEERGGAETASERRPK